MQTRSISHRTEVRFQNPDSLVHRPLPPADQQPETSTAKEEETDPRLEATVVFSDDEEEDNDGVDDEEKLLAEAAKVAERQVMDEMMDSIVMAFPDVEREWLRERLTEHRANPDCLQVGSYYDIKIL